MHIRQCSVCSCRSCFYHWYAYIIARAHYNWSSSVALSATCNFWRTKLSILSVIILLVSAASEGLNNLILDAVVFCIA